MRAGLVAREDGRREVCSVGGIKPDRAMQNSLGEVRVVTVVTVLAVAATSASASRAPRPIRRLVEIGLRAKGNERTKKAPRHEVAGRRDSARAVDSFFVASAIAAGQKAHQRPSLSH
jgi:hypothetical protein